MARKAAPTLTEKSLPRDRAEGPLQRMHRTLREACERRRWTFYLRLTDPTLPKGSEPARPPPWGLQRRRAKRRKGQRSGAPSAQDPQGAGTVPVKRRRRTARRG